MTTGSQVDRAINGWINPAAFTAAPAFTFGNVPRTNPDWRGPGQRETEPGDPEVSSGSAARRSAAAWTS